MTRYAPQWLQAGSYAASQDRRLISALWPNPAVTGCAVTPASAMTLNIAAGTVAVPTPNNTGSVLCTSDATEQVTLGAAPVSPNNRIDLIVCQARGNDLDGGVNNDFLFAVVAGAVAASPVAPAVPAGAVAIAQVFVGSGVANIVAGNITDARPLGGLAVPPATGPLTWWGQNNGGGAIPSGGNLTTALVTVANLPPGDYLIQCATAVLGPTTGMIQTVGTVWRNGVVLPGQGNGVDVRSANGSSTSMVGLAFSAIDHADPGGAVAFQLNLFSNAAGANARSMNMVVQKITAMN